MKPTFYVVLPRKRRFVVHPTSSYVRISKPTNQLKFFKRLIHSYNLTVNINFTTSFTINKSEQKYCVMNFSKSYSIAYKLSVDGRLSASQIINKNVIHT